MVIISCIYLSLRLSNNVKSPSFCVKIIALDILCLGLLRAGEVFLPGKSKRLLPATRPHFSPARRHILFRAGLSYTIFMALLFLVRRRHYCHLHILLLTVGNTGIFTSLLIVRHLNGISFINLLLSPRHCLHLFLGRVGHNLLRQRHVTH